MDRPEDVEPSPVTGRIYIACTKSEDRETIESVDQWSGRDVDMMPNAANPRPNNRSGHIIEIREAGDDATATRFEWNVFLLAGNPTEGRYMVDARDLIPAGSARRTPISRVIRNRAEVSEVHCPDNLGIDPSGRLWIVTDTDNRGQPNNGCFVVPTEGPERGLPPAAGQWTGGLRVVRLRIHARRTHVVPDHPASGRRRHARETPQSLAGRERPARAGGPAGHRTRGRRHDLTLLAMERSGWLPAGKVRVELTLAQIRDAGSPTKYLSSTTLAFRLGQLVYQRNDLERRTKTLAIKRATCRPHR